MRALLSALTLGLAFVCGGLVEAHAQQSAPPIRYIIVDSSGSMAAPHGDRLRIDEARSVVRQELASAPGQQVALLRLGGDEEKRCEALETLAPIRPSTENASLVEQQVAALTPAGSTPLAASLEHAVREIGDQPAEIVLITDGADTCGRNVCELAARWRLEERAISVRVRGVGIDPLTSDAFGCLSAVTQSQPAPAKPKIEPSPPLPNLALAPWIKWARQGLLALGGMLCLYCLASFLVPDRSVLRRKVLDIETDESRTINEDQFALSRAEYKERAGLSGQVGNLVVEASADGQKYKRVLHVRRRIFLKGSQGPWGLANGRFQLNGTDKNTLAEAAFSKDLLSDSAKNMLSELTYRLTLKQPSHLNARYWLAHPDQEVRLTIWLTLLTTVVSIVQGLFFELVLFPR